MPITLSLQDVAAFLRARRRNPADQAPGLILADYLSEHGAYGLEAMHRHPTEPGNPAALIQSQPHSRDAWRETAEALHQYGKPNTANALALLSHLGEQVGTTHPQLWNQTILPYEVPHESFVHSPHVLESRTARPYSQDVIPTWGPTVTFNTGGIEFSLHPMHHQVVVQQPRPIGGYTPTHFFVRMGIKHQDHIPSFPTTAGGTFVSAEHGKHMMREADLFKSEQDAMHAGDYTGEDYRHMQFSMIANTPENRIRGLLRLPLKLEKDLDPERESPPDKVTTSGGESFTYPEHRFLESAQKKTLKQHEELVQHAVAPSTQPFESSVPTPSLLGLLARLGAPAKGEYEKTFGTVKQMFGHDPDGITAWIGLNSVFSPNTSYADHASAASLITAHWLNRKKPTDPDTIRNMISEIRKFGRDYTPNLARKYPGEQPYIRKPGVALGGTVYATRHVEDAVSVLQNVEKLREALADPTGEAAQHLDILGGGGTSKKPNFAMSYPFGEYGTAIDTHMLRLLMHPTLDNFKLHSDVWRQVRAHLSRPGELDRLEKLSLKGMPIKSELVRLLMEKPDIPIKVKATQSLGRKGADTITINEWLKTLNTKMFEKPQNYLAYKFAVNEAAKKLGWTAAQVQESVWTAVVSIMAANELGIPKNKIAQALTQDALRKGWNNHEAVFFPSVADALARGGVDKSTLRRLAEGQNQRTAKASRSGILRKGDEAAIGHIATHLPGINARSAGKPVMDHLRKMLEEQGLLDPNTGKYRLQMRLMAHYDQPLDFANVLQRIHASNQQPFMQGLQQALQQAGVIPQKLTPAVHDVSGQARASIIAIGQYANRQSPRSAAAWTGLLGRQPGMLSFTGNPRGKDSVYHFSHHSPDIVRNVLQAHGVFNRTIVPEGNSYSVYVYDPANKYRTGMARALTELHATATEWRGDGQTLGGNLEDMGRAQYRDTINKVEGGQPGA